MHALQPVLSFVLDGDAGGGKLIPVLFWFSFSGWDRSLSPTQTCSWLTAAEVSSPESLKTKLLTCISFQLPQVEKHSAEHAARLFYSLTLWTAAGWSRRRGMLNSSFLAPSTRRGASPLISLFLPFIALLLFLLLRARLRFSSAVLLKATHEYGLTSEKHSPRTDCLYHFFWSQLNIECRQTNVNIREK